jgi:parallel beta-helix repeat protein
MKNRSVTMLMLSMLIIETLIISFATASEVTLTLSDAELSTQFAKGWGPPGSAVTTTDILGPGVRFDFVGLQPASGTDVSDNYPVSPLAGGAPDNIGGWGNFQAYTQYRQVFTNLGPNPVTIDLEMNTGWTNPVWQRDTYWGGSYFSLAVGESKVVTLDFSSVGEAWNAQDDPVPEWRYLGGTSGICVRRLDEVSRIGFQVLGNGIGSIVVSQIIPTDVVLAPSDTELSTQFARETGPATLVAVTDIPGPGVRFDLTGLSSSIGTVVGDNFAVSALAGGAWKDYGSGFAGPYDFSGYSRYCMLFTNVGTTTLKVNLKMNTGWTGAPWGRPENDTFWQNSWTTIAPGESRFVTLDFWSAEVYNAGDDPQAEWRYSDGTSGVIVRRLDEVSDIGFQVLGGSDGSIIVTGETILSLSDAELSTQFAKEYGPGTLAAITDIPGPGVRFEFTGLQPSLGTTVGDNFAVSALAGGAYKTYGVTNPFSTWGDFSGYTKYKMIFTNVGSNAVTVNLKLNTGWTILPPEYAVAWRDTFWQDTWTNIAPGESKVITLDFSSAEIYNAADEQEFTPHPDGTSGILVWRLDEVSDIGFQILGNSNATIIVSARLQCSDVYVDDDYANSTPGWGFDHFAKIQDGIDAVAPSGTVHVYDGTYNEQATVNKDNLHILAGSSPILDGAGLGTSGFIITADYIEIGGFIIQNFTSTTAGVAGIELRGANHCWIHDNEIRTNNHGILFGDSTMATYPSNAYNTIEYNTVHDNNNPAAEWYYTGIGINYWYGDSSHNTVYKNSIYNHDRNGILVGQHERYSPSYAVGYGGHTDWNIMENNVDHSGWYGIEITNGLDSKIEQNTVNNTGSFGIIVQAWDYAGVYNVNVTSNMVDKSGLYGIYVVTQQDATTPISSTVHHVRIESNDVCRSGYYGIVTYSSSVVSGIHHLTINCNEVYNNKYYGMLFYDLVNSKVSHNEVYHNGELDPSALRDGIYMYTNSGSNEISYNNIHNNGRHGIKVVTNGHTIEYNKIEDNGQDGIFIDSDNNIIERNKITGNTGSYSGIHLTSTADGNEIHFNCIVGNNGTNVYGVYKEGGADANATYNWWGDSTGPYHPTKNPLGSGNRVSDYVLFEPWLRAYFDYFPHNPIVGEPITFDASLSIQCMRTIVSYTWDFADGNITTTNNPIIIHAFAAPGDYNVTLTLTYDDTTTGTEWALVHVAKMPYFKVEPQLIELGLLNKTFSVNVTMNDLDVSQRTVALQFRLCYNATLMQFMNITEGPFMTQAGDTFFIRSVEEDGEYGPNILVGILVLPDENGIWHTFPQGNGVLTTITFKAINQERGLEKPPLTCSLILNDTLIVDDQIEEVPHTTQDGTYIMHPTNIADINYDGKVDVRDVSRVAAAFGETVGRPRWDPICDIVPDGKINVKDVALVCWNYGWRSTYDP